MDWSDFVLVLIIVSIIAFGAMLVYPPAAIVWVVSAAASAGLTYQLVTYQDMKLTVTLRVLGLIVFGCIGMLALMGLLRLTLELLVSF